MSSESNTTERLIDLMYDEASDESREEFLEEIAGSPDLQRDQAEIRALLGDVSELWSEQPVRASVHQSIMDAAQSATLERAEKRQYVTPIPPPGLWSRLRSSSQFGQFAMVATVLIAGAFVFKFVNLEESKVVDEAAVFSPNFGSDPEKGVPIAAADKKGVDGLDAIAAPKSALTNLPAKKAEFAQDLQKEPSVGQAPINTGKKDMKVESKKRVRSKTKKGAVKSAKSRRSTRVQTTKNAIPSGSAQNKAYFDTLADDENDLKKSGASGSINERIQNAEELKLVPSKTIDSVSSKYGARDYRGTIQAADEFVGLKSGTRGQRARALQLKAQSLANLGRYQEAIRVYDSILKNYKTYQSSSISSARAEISRKLEERRPAKKSRKKAKKESKETNYDFDEANTY